MPCRALFVDDEPSLRGIYEALGCILGDEFAISTASCAQEAKEKTSREAPDIIISDLVMPGQNGAELLLDLSQAYPECGRIVVSAFADQITLARSLTVAHRYFTKPFSPIALTEAIQDLHGMRKGADDRLAKLVGAIKSLPVAPETYFALNKALTSHTTSLDSIAELVQKDPSLCSKLLQAANSAMFGSRDRCERIADAIHVIGLETIRTLMLGVQVFELCPDRNFRAFLDRLWQHSLEVAEAAREYAQKEDCSGKDAEQAFIAGLLHDLGKVVLAASSPKGYNQIIQQFPDSSEESREAERAAFGATHAYAGAYLLKLWGIPERIVNAVAEHHSGDETGDILTAAVKAAHQKLIWEKAEKQRRLKNAR